VPLETLLSKLVHVVLLHIYIGGVWFKPQQGHHLKFFMIFINLSRLTSTSCQINFALIINDVIQSEILTAPLNKPQMNTMKTPSWHLPGETGKLQKPCARIAGILTKSQNANLPTQVKSTTDWANLFVTFVQNTAAVLLYVTNICSFCFEFCQYLSMS